MSASDRYTQSLQRQLRNVDTKQGKTTSYPDGFARSFPETAPGNKSTLEARECSSPWGLTMVYSPQEVIPSADFVFIHGLRGDQVKTWCYKGSEKYFWLRDWLPKHPELKNARIWTFGYDSDFLAIGPGNVSDLSDFARSLLVSMKLSTHGIPTEYQVPIGKVSLPYTSDLECSRDVVQSHSSKTHYSTYPLHQNISISNLHPDTVDNGCAFDGRPCGEKR